MSKKYAIASVLLIALIVSLSAVDMDGKIQPGEYHSSQVLRKNLITLYWQIDGDRIHLAMEAKSRGWIAIGLDPGFAMSNSDMIFGLVDANGKATVVDAWCKGTFGPHPADVDQGGTDDILACAGSRTGDTVVFECSRRLDTKDKADKTIAVGKAMKVIWATGADLTFTSKHSMTGSATVSFGAAQ